MSGETNQDADIVALKKDLEKAPSLSAGEFAAIPALTYSSEVMMTMSPGDAGELWEQATRLAAIYRQPVEVVLRDLQTVLEWDYKLRNSPPEEFDSEGNIISLEDEKPQLGLATTRQLLEEVSVRMRMTQNSLRGTSLGDLCDEALEQLAQGVLDYRTVDH